MTQSSIAKTLKIATAVGVAFTLTLGATLASAATTTIDLNGSRVSFTNSTKIGIDAQAGFTHRYPGAVNINGQVADAILTLKSFTANNVKPTVSNIDRVSSFANFDLFTNLQLPSGGGSAEYTVSFVNPTNGDPVALKGVTINVGDIDANQYVQFSGVQKYSLANPTALVAQTTGQVGTIPAGSYRFYEPNGAGDTSNTDPKFIAQVSYDLPISSFDVVLGATTGGAALFQVSFAAAEWGSATVNTTTLTPSVVSYTVNYNANGATGAVPNSTTEVGGAAHTITGNTGHLTKQNATFAGWNTRPDGSGVTYEAGDTMIPTTDVTLYAIWNENITTTYSANCPGATGTVPAPVTTSTGAQTISAPGSLACPGYVFNGWNTVAGGTGVPYEPGQTFQPIANGTLHAQWLAIPTVPPNSPIDITANVGDQVGGSEATYVVPNLTPNSEFTLDVLGPNGITEIDAGTVDSSGTVIGTADLPENIPQGEYALSFESVAPDGIVTIIEKDFTVGPNGLLTSKQDGVTTKTVDPHNPHDELANTGSESMVMTISALALVTLGVATVIMSHRRVRVAIRNDYH